MIKDKVIVVTGASQGIGEELVRSFSKEGGKVVLALRNIGKMKRISKELNSPHLVCLTDVRDEDSVKSTVDKVIDKFGTIDVLVNNAGYVEPVGLLEMTLKHWNDMLETNLTGTFLCTKECVKIMKKRRKNNKYCFNRRSEPKTGLEWLCCK